MPPYPATGIAAVNTRFKPVRYTEAMRPAAQRGNILFIILLAVVLLAALTYAVNNGLRGGTPDAIPAEKAKSMAAQILQNANLIENNMMRAMTVDGIPDYGFDVSSRYGGTANATCTKTACKIYADNGGGVPMLVTPSWASTDPTLNNNPLFHSTAVLNVGTSQPDLIYIRFYLKPEVCKALNDILGITIDFSQLQGIGTLGDYTGTLTSFPTSPSNTFGTLPNGIAGQKAFCTRHPGWAGYYFVYVMMAR